MILFMWRPAGWKTRVGTLIKGQLNVVHAHDEVSVLSDVALHSLSKGKGWPVTFITAYRQKDNKRRGTTSSHVSVVAVGVADSVAVVRLWFLCDACCCVVVLLCCCCVVASLRRVAVFGVVVVVCCGAVPLFVGGVKLFG